MLRRKQQAKCATPSIKDLLEALDLEERNDHQMPDHVGMPTQLVSPHGHVSPQGHVQHLRAAMQAQVAMPGLEPERHLRPLDQPYDPIVPNPRTFIDVPMRQLRPAEILPSRLEPQRSEALRSEPQRSEFLRPEPLRPVHDVTDSEALARLAAASRSGGVLSYAAAVIGALVVMVPSALYLMAPLIWKDASSKQPAPATASAVTTVDDVRPARRALAVASVAVVPIASPRADLPATAPLASSANDFARFSALSHAATAMRLPAPDAQAQAPSPAATAPTAAADRAPAQPSNAASLVALAEPPAGPAAAMAADATSIARQPVLNALPAVQSRPAPVATTTLVIAPTPPTPMVGEPLRARVPLTALGVHSPGVMVTTTKPAAAPITAPLSAPSNAGPSGTAPAVVSPGPNGALSAARASILIERGRQLAALGDIAGARVLYELAANGGNAEGKRLFEETLASSPPAKSTASASLPAVAVPRPKFVGASALGAPGAGEGLARPAATPAN